MTFVSRTGSSVRRLARLRQARRAVARTMLAGAKKRWSSGKIDARRFRHAPTAASSGSSGLRPAFGLPLAPARLEQPQPHHVRQQAHGAEDAGLVRESRPVQARRPTAAARRARRQRATTCPTRCRPTPARAACRRRRSPCRGCPVRPPAAARSRGPGRARGRSVPIDGACVHDVRHQADAAGRAARTAHRPSVPVRASSSWVVDAFVRSDTSDPHRR